MDQTFVKSLRTRILSLGLAVCGAAWGQAQQQPQTPPEDRPAPPGSASRPNIQQPPPPPPRLPDVRQPGETGWWFGLTSWFPTQKPTFDKGRAATFTDPTKTTFEGTPKYSAGADLGIAIGLHNTLRFSFQDVKATGDIQSIPVQIQAWGQTYPAGTYLATSYHLQHGSISMDYLTWPYPVESRRFRLKTLWQVQYTNVKSTFDAPKSPIADANGNPLVDSNGNLISYAGSGSHWFISPMFGVQTMYYYGRHFRWEAKASGWGWPHHNAIWDADTSANLRYGHFELGVGFRGFHFKTSTQGEYYTHGTYAAGFAGLRWYSQ
jgi:hypothetical protein